MEGVWNKYWNTLLCLLLSCHALYILKTHAHVSLPLAALYNFHDDSENKLKLTVGDAVHLLHECDGWYHGRILQNKHRTGVFPKSYVHVRECVVDDTGITPLFILQQPTIVQEITTVLRDWNTHWKSLYVVSGYSLWLKIIWPITF